MSSVPVLDFHPPPRDSKWAPTASEVNDRGPYSLHGASFCSTYSAPSGPSYLGLYHAPLDAEVSLRMLALQQALVDIHFHLGNPLPSVNSVYIILAL